MKSETAFSQWVCKRLRSTGVYVLNLHGHAMQQRGWPDLYVCCREYRGFVELKYQDGRLSKLQKVMCYGLWKRGETVCVLKYFTRNRREMYSLQTYEEMQIASDAFYTTTDVRGLLAAHRDALTRAFSQE